MPQRWIGDLIKNEIHVRIQVARTYISFLASVEGPLYSSVLSVNHLIKARPGTLCLTITCLPGSRNRETVLCLTTNVDTVVSDTAGSSD